MAIYIPLEKNFEDDERAEYKFGKDEKHYGTLAIDKMSGEVSILEKAFHEDQAFVTQRAIRKTQLNWKNGYFPVKTSWSA